MPPKSETQKIEEKEAWIRQLYDQLKQLRSSNASKDDIDKLDRSIRSNESQLTKMKQSFEKNKQEAAQVRIQRAQEEAASAARGQQMRQDERQRVLRMSDNELYQYLQNNVKTGYGVTVGLKLDVPGYVVNEAQRRNHPGIMELLSTSAANRMQENSEHRSGTVAHAKHGYRARQENPGL
eukprot:TRINITY_DN97249_c0_g1_i1.p1 TRINITY_DN97249_c0_g1~~TRINITY_DN97249_c0_g1_i1.p1  ORF type:complete len:210 (+),score=39.07 TRINITY_DN97249_c0_g1_i1:91-630(+)